MLIECTSRYITLDLILNAVTSAFFKEGGGSRFLTLQNHVLTLLQALFTREIFILLMTEVGKDSVMPHLPSFYLSLRICELCNHFYIS